MKNLGVKGVHIA